MEIRSHSTTVKLYVVEKLVTYLILGCDFCDKHIEEIRPRQSIVEPEDGITAPILLDAVARSRNNAPIP